MVGQVRNVQITGLFLVKLATKVIDAKDLRLSILWARSS